MRLVYINPNSTEAMTDGIVAVARAALPEADIVGVTNPDAPPAIQGAEDGAAAVPGLLACVDRVAGEADAIVIACFDDTGLTEARGVSPVPVLGIGQAGYTLATLLGLRFSVVTSLPVSIPVIEGNIRDGGFAASCVSVRASGLPVLDIDRGGDRVLHRLSQEIALARDEDGARAVILGCAGMAPLVPALAPGAGVRLIDGVAASARLAVAVA